jgi:CRISPR system Cascade subunit CasC
MTRFIQIHWLTSYPAALLNRDDSGLAKRMPFGGSLRTRISSQCLKRHWRTVDDEWSLASLSGLADIDYGKRSRVHLKTLVAEPLIREGLAEADVIKTTAAVRARLFPPSKDDAGEKGKAKKEKISSLDDLDTPQAILLGGAEVDYLKRLVRRAVTEDGDLAQALDAKRGDIAANIAELGVSATLPRGLESALFGRFVTSDLLANTDAPIHVAHAMTVHVQENESDYFTVVDDITRESGASGSAGMFDVELTSGLYYGYVAVDVPLLIANLSNDATLAGKVAEHLVHLVATVTPGAKLGSTAPYDYAELVLVETGDRQPRKLSSAFRKAVAPQMDAATSALVSHLSKLDAAYGSSETRRHMAVDPLEIVGSKSLSLSDLGTFARDTVTRSATPRTGA